MSRAYIFSNSIETGSKAVSAKQLLRSFSQTTHRFYIHTTGAGNAKGLWWKKNNNQGTLYYAFQRIPDKAAALRIKPLISLQWNVLQPTTRSFCGWRQFTQNSCLILIWQSLGQIVLMRSLFPAALAIINTESLAWVSRPLFPSRGQGPHSTTLKETWQHSAQVERLLDTAEWGKACCPAKAYRPWGWPGSGRSWLCRWAKLSREGTGSQRRTSALSGWIHMAEAGCKIRHPEQNPATDALSQLGLSRAHHQ